MRSGACQRTQRPDAETRARLRILSTTDLHMSLLPYDYLADRPVDGPALSQLAGLIARLRAQEPATLLFDSGDFLQGGPMGDLLGIPGNTEPAGMHPMIAAMNALGYDAVTLGNHEFNYGLDYILRCIEGATFPVVSSNLVRRLGPTPLQDEPVASPCTMLSRPMRLADGRQKTLRIGIIGLAPPQTVQWEAEKLQGQVAARGMVEAAQAWQAELRARGADLVLALAHTGIGADDDMAGAENAALALARLPGIDALLMGHMHEVFPGVAFRGHPQTDPRAGRIAGRPAVMAGQGGSHLGIIDLDLRVNLAGAWRIAGSHVQVQPARSECPDGSRLDHEPAAARVRKAVQTAHSRTLAHVRAVLGHTDTALHSFFALLGDSPVQRVVARAHRHWLQHASGAELPPGVPVLVAVPCYRTGGAGGPDAYTNVPPGPLAMRHMHDLYPFPNLLAALHLSGAEIRDWLERVAGLYCGLPRTQDDGQTAQHLTDGNVAGWNYDVIDGLDYGIDLSAPPLFDACGARVGTGAGRIRELCFGDRPVRDADRFVLVTSSFRANGGGPFPVIGADRRIHVRPTYGRDALASHFSDSPQFGPLRPARRRFVPQPGRSVLFETAPAAQSCLDEIADYRPQPCGMSNEGFLRLRLHL